MKVRYLVKFSKEKDIKFVSHLDLLRTIQRVVRRSQLPVEYSKGFNPHMSTSLAQPLSVGMYSTGEYMDIVLTEEVSESKIIADFNNNAPAGVRLLDAAPVKEAGEGKKVPPSMALVDAAKYIITIKYSSIEKLSEEFSKLFEQSEWNIIKKTKNGEKLINIRGMIRDFSYTIEEDCVRITALVSSGSRENLSADLLAQFIKNNTAGIKEDAFVDIMREDMYVQLKDKYVSLCDYVRL
ncbi:TIGR03936 family radical SAM-associated protein [Clostridium swellfunianum]|uniref:TIGR03936 family radical SAM-associated protein n=1 Tax=Clostridium swellfunianum TaxID=1367462 RepID=UPI00202F5FB7|nr:TIGR03936 family radical SAM-associated protein [Clostridium swellfunianum]MCM0648951.1 TIGR03936 family radical SAM-associated protein [Clostridium swellfunianum]